MIDDLHRQLSEALRDVLGRDRHNGGLRKAQKVARAALADYDSALAAESAAAKQATEKMMGVDDDGQHGVGA